MHQYFNHSLDLPYSNSVIKYRELTTQEQILLSKINLTVPYNNDGFYEYFCVLNDILKNCIKNTDMLDQMDIMEYVMFVTKLRILSIGNTIEFIIENTEQENIKKQKIIINLSFFIKELYNNSKSFLDEKIREKNININFKWPSVKDIDIFLKASDIDTISKTLGEFIKDIKIENASINFQKFNNEQKQELLDKLSISLKQKIENKIFQNLESLMDKNLLGIDYFKNQKFSIYGFGFISFLRMFFSYDIKNLFQEIHYLSDSGLDSNYILNISPSERKIYINIVNEHNKAKQSSSSGESSIGTSKTLEDLAVEFNQQ